MKNDPLLNLPPTEAAWDSMEEITPPVKQSVKSEKKHRKRGEVSFHRDRKTAPHITINGLGLIARLRRAK